MSVRLNFASFTGRTDNFVSLANNTGKTDKKTSTNTAFFAKRTGRIVSPASITGRTDKIVSPASLQK